MLSVGKLVIMVSEMPQPLTEMSKFSLLVMTTVAVSLCWVNIASSREPTCCSRAVTADYDAQGLTQEFTTKTVRSGIAGRIDPPCEKNFISLKAGASRGGVRAKQINVPFFTVEFQVDEHVEVNGKKEGTDRQMVPYNRSSSRSYATDFAVQPTVVKDREACFDVTGGDGIRFMSGRCSDTLTQPGDDLLRTTHEVYEWQVYRR